MNGWVALELAIGLLQGIVQQTSNQTDDLIVAGAKAALEELQKVHGAPVTKAQLENLRTIPQW